MTTCVWQLSGDIYDPLIIPRYDQFLARYGSGAGAGRRIRGDKVFRLHLVAPWAASIVRHARLLAVVRAVLDTANVLVWSSDLTVRGVAWSE